MNIVARSLHSRITEQGQDSLGRWTYIRFSTKQSSMIYFITVYKPCKTTLRQAGPMTVFRQQWTELRSRGDPNPNPRNQFDNDFLKFVESIQQQHHRIIIVGDFNESIQKSKLLQKLRTYGLKDMIHDRHHNMPKFRSCIKGTNIIDYAYCSTSIFRHITASTYEPFYLNVDSDHRGIVIDLNRQTLFGRQDPLAITPSRGVTSTNTTQTEAFLLQLSVNWKNFDINQRIQSIQSNTQKDTIREDLNAIDQDITTAILKAEQHVKRRARPPWSPTLREASLRVKLLKLYFRQFVGKDNLSSAIKHTKLRMSTSHNLTTPQTKRECQTQLRRAQKDLRQIRRKAYEIRAQYLETLAMQYNIQGDKSKESIIKRIQQAEATKQCYRKLRWILKPPKPGVTFIQRTNQQGNTETLYDRQKIEEAILNRNRRHFNQCAGTPFTTGRLRDLNWAADSPLAESILDGTCNVEEVSTSTATQIVLTQSKRLQPEQQQILTKDDLKNLFKVWRESTTTSPSGRHLGIYKCIYSNTTNKYAPTIAQNITSLTNLLLQNGIGLDRWRKVINLMIHKLDESFLINKLRVIHLFEADYNGTIGILFNRKVLYNAEQKGLLNNNQWGCRPHRQAEDALMLKELTYNLSTLTKTTLATFDNDATGCFDRVPCSMAMLASRRLGADTNMCRLQADTLQHIQHQLRTAFGLSDKTYTSDSTTEIHGQGQGSRAGPPTWVFVSSLLLDCMSKHASGVSFTCPSYELTHKRHNDAFVDDVTGYVNQFTEELRGETVLDDILSTMQQDANLWNNLLHTSGGKLALQKCLYYIVAWQWNHGHATSIPSNAIYPKITIQQTDNLPTPITHLNSTTAHRTLGQMKAPLGDQQKQIEYMTK